MSQSINALNATLQEVNTTLQQGQAIAQSTIDQLNAAAQSAQASLNQAQDKTQALIQKAKDSRSALEQQLAGLKPQNIPADPQAVLQQAFGFLDSVRGALEDGKLGRDEVLQIGQLGADLQAGLGKNGSEPRFKGLSQNVDQITKHLARGQFGPAKNSLNRFETQLGPRPANIPPRKRP
jgi:soluble cytochrome b562